MVSQSDDVQIVFDDDDGIATIYQSLQHIHQNADVLEVQSRGRLVQNVQRLTRILLRQFGSQLYTLALTTAKRCRGLSQFDVAKTNVLDCLNLAQDIGA